MNEAMRFVREVVAMAKDRGLSCMVMADGAYAFTGEGNLKAIMGEPSGVLNEQAWKESDKEKAYTFQDLLNYVENPDIKDDDIMETPSRTQREIEMDTTFYISKNSDEKSVTIYENRGEGSEHEPIIGIEFFTCPFEGCRIVQLEPDGTEDSTFAATSRRCIETISSTVLHDMPSYISAALIQFMMHALSCI